ncbi:hypothetical protein ACFYPN_12730 [Streptomyces sp. NPDC005576]|uniref:hypothetical protein n=1 Tax=unclassified Streptomyces TaxID=2593676 RepID=UPI0033BFE384
MQPPQPHHAPGPTVPEQPRNRTRTVLLPLLAGLVLGAAGTGVAWALSTGGASAEGSPAADARAACQALDGFDPNLYTAKGPAGDIALNRYAAAGALSASAAAGDARYKPLAQAIRDSQQRHSVTFEFGPAVMKDLDHARALCDDV